VTGYIIKRNGAVLTTVGAVATYTDTGLTADTAYQYTVTAQDGSGGSSAESNTVYVNTHSNGTVTLNPVADVYVDSGSTTDFGSSITLRTTTNSGSPSATRYSYLRFQVPAVAGNITGVTLHIFANSASSQGYTLFSTAGGWAEHGLTFANAPAAGSSLGNSGAFTASAWTTINLTAVVSAAGEYNFEMKSTTDPGSNVSYSSREGANPPQLVLTLSNDNTPPTAPTLTGNAVGTTVTLNWSGATDQPHPDRRCRGVCLRRERLPFPEWRPAAL